ncbi:MAG: hypothetical protein ABIO04_13030 [Ferruginibacter sp.]
MIRFFFVFFVFNSFSFCSQAQNNGILPLTGLRYFNEGISAKSMEVRVDGSLLLNNRLPANKEFEIRLVLPVGFTDKGKIVFPAAEYGIYSAKGELLSLIPNLFKDKESSGFSSAGFKELVVKIQLKPEQVRTEQSCIVKVRVYDIKSSNQLRLEFPISIARAGEVLQLSKSVNLAKSGSDVVAISNGVKIKSIVITVDTSIRINPKMAYMSLDMGEISGSGNSEILSGKENFWIYDNNLNEIKVPDRQLKQIKSSMEDNIVDYLSKIPYRLKSAIGKIYTVRFRWESPDKHKIIDVVVTR